MRRRMVPGARCVKEHAGSHRISGARCIGCGTPYTAREIAFLSTLDPIQLARDLHWDR